MKSKTSGQTRQTPLERYVRALEIVASADGAVSLSELAERARLPLGTAHRLAAALVRTGLLYHEGPRGGFTLGKRLQRLAYIGIDTGFLRISVKPILEDLADTLGSTCFLASLRGTTVATMAWAVPPQGTFRGFVSPEHLMPPHASAAAKAILAFQDETLIEEILSAPLPKLTSRTIIGKKNILKEYSDVRKRGYATCWSEIEEGLGAVAYPIVLPRADAPLYSVATSGFGDRLKQRPIAQTVNHLKSAAQRLQDVLLNAAIPAADREIIMHMDRGAARQHGKKA